LTEREKGKSNFKLILLDIKAKEAKWALEQGEREIIAKQVAEKKIEIKFLDADIETKKNILKELEEKAVSSKQASPSD
jgi:hypothetical protein